MCGRTACTLPSNRLIQACTYKGKNKRENKENVKDVEQETPKEEEKDATVICPVWREPPCGGVYRPSANIPPTQYTPILFTDSSQQVLLQPMLWGLVPSWHTGPSPTSHGLSTNNARLEGVADSKLYCGALSKRRCVVVCDGFYEWQRDGGTKVPYLVYSKLNNEEATLEKQVEAGRIGSDEGDWSGHQLLYLAGLYSVWSGGGGAPVYSYTVLTRQSNSTLSWLHHRMPCFLEQHQLAAWLCPSTPWKEAESLLNLPGSDFLSWHRVSSAVGNTRNQDINLINRVSPGEEEASKGKLDRSVSKASKGLMANWLKRGSASEEASNKKLKI